MVWFAFTSGRENVLSFSVMLLVGLCDTVLAQQEAVEVGSAMAEQLKPYRECLKAEVAKATFRKLAQVPHLSILTKLPMVH
ncbi:hypothetical protein AB7M16_002390 [Bradyrhizobium sp. USDA 372]